MRTWPKIPARPAMVFKDKEPYFLPLLWPGLFQQTIGRSMYPKAK
jgi:hypothetical protein